MSIARKVARDAMGTLSIYDSSGRVIEEHSYEPAVIKLGIRGKV